MLFSLKHPSADVSPHGQVLWRGAGLWKEGTGASEQDVGREPGDKELGEKELEEKEPEEKELGEKELGEKEPGEKEPALPLGRGRREGHGCAVTGCGC